MSKAARPKPKFHIGQFVIIEGWDARVMQIAEVRENVYVDIDFYYRKWHTSDWLKESQLRPLTKRERE